MKIYREETIIVEDVQNPSSVQRDIERYLKVEGAEVLEPPFISVLEPGGTCKLRVRRWIGNIE